MLAPQIVEVGKPLCLSGYADDYGNQIVAVEFSLDGGEHWTSYDVSSSDSELSVQWQFVYTPPEVGSYVLQVRSVRDDGARSPEPDVVCFTAIAPEACDARTGLGAL